MQIGTKIKVLIVLMLLSGCSVVDYLFYQSPVDNQSKLNNLLTAYRDSAMSGVDFEDLKDNISFYKGKYLELKGYLIDERKTEFLFYADPYFDLNYGFYYINIDNPLPKQRAYDKPLHYLTIGDKIILIAIVKNLKSYGLDKPIQLPISNYFITISGDQFIDIPALDGIVIYKIDDYNLKNPVWVTEKILEEFGSVR
jgi:hypothetical protein